jgi:hypothetical protein
MVQQVHTLCCMCISFAPPPPSLCPCFALAVSTTNFCCNICTNFVRYLLLPQWLTAGTGIGSGASLAASQVLLLHGTDTSRVQLKLFLELLLGCASRTAPRCTTPRSRCYHHRAATTTALPPLLRCHHHCVAITTAQPPLLRCHHYRATTTTALPPPRCHHTTTALSPLLCLANFVETTDLRSDEILYW